MKVRPPFASFPAGAGGLVAGPNGVVFGQFGWVYDDGTVSNTYAAGTILVFVLPPYDAWNWQRVYPLPPSWTNINESGYPENPLTNTTNRSQLVLRAGQQVVAAPIGDYVTTFQYGVMAGVQVYADPATGNAVDASFTGGIPTQWTTMRAGSGGAPVRISTSVQPIG